MNPSDLTSATAARHVDDLRAAARHADLAAQARGCRETTIERAARLLHVSRRGSSTCGS